MRPGPFGHEHMADRAQVLLWSNQAFRRLPRHVRSLDVGGFRSDGTMISLGDVEEFFLLTEYAEGEGYFRDLEQLRDTGILRDSIWIAPTRCAIISVEIHSKSATIPGCTPGAFANWSDTENASWALPIAMRRIR